MSEGVLLSVTSLIVTGKFNYMVLWSIVNLVIRPSQGFWGKGEQGHLFQGNKGQILRGTGEQRQYWRTGNMRKQIFDFGGTGEQVNLFQGNKGTGTPLGGSQL